MKKAIMLMALLLIGAVHAQENLDSGTLRVTLINQDPDPVGPGEYVDIRLQVENYGGTSLDNVMLEFVPSFPFTLDPGQSSMVNVGTLAAFQNGERAFVKKFKVRVDSEAIEGTNTIKVRAKEGNKNWATYEFDINIRTSDANLAIESVTTSPETVEPGSDATVQIKVKNLADSVLKDISVNLDLTLSTITTASIDALPFATIDSGTEKRLRLLAPGEEGFFTYKLRAYPTADSRVYKIPVQIDYKDELNTEYSRNSLIGVVVNSEPDISVVLENNEIDQAGQTGQITVKVINKGLTDIKFADVTMGDSDSFDLLSEKEVYIGNIDSDDYDTADFDIYVKSSASGTVDIPIHYEYMDANNNEYSFNKDLELKLITAQQAEEYGATSGPSRTNIIVISSIIVVVLLFIIWRIYKRCKA